MATAAGSLLFTFFQATSEFSSAFFEVTMITQLVSALVFAGLDSDKFCQIQKQSSDMQTQIDQAQKAWDDVIAGQTLLDKDFIQDRVRDYTELGTLHQKYVQIQTEFQANKVRFAVGVFILILLVALNLFLSYFLKKQKNLKK